MTLNVNIFLPKSCFKVLNIDIMEFYSLVSPVFNLMQCDEQIMNEVNIH